MTPEELRKFVEKCGASQEELSRHLGVSRSMLWRYYTGERRITEEFAAKVKALTMLPLPTQKRTSDMTHAEFKRLAKPWKVTELAELLELPIGTVRNYIGGASETRCVSKKAAERLQALLESKVQAISKVTEIDVQEEIVAQVIALLAPDGTPDYNQRIIAARYIRRAAAILSPAETAKNKESRRRRLELISEQK